MEQPKYDLEKISVKWALRQAAEASELVKLAETMVLTHDRDAMYQLALARFVRIASSISDAAVSSDHT